VNAVVFAQNFEQRIELSKIALKNNSVFLSDSLHSPYARIAEIQNKLKEKKPHLATGLLKKFFPLIIP